MDSGLGGDFDIDQFQHYSTYNQKLDAVESYLVSNRTQEVRIEDLDKTYTFEKKEPVHIEYSHKFGEDDIALMAQKAGFKITDQFYDGSHLLADSLWRVVK
ncbi:L-histidine N(alpha)-methyltransferase [Chloroflexota bacterium]